MYSPNNINQNKIFKSLTNNSPCKCMSHFPLIVITHHGQSNLQKERSDSKHTWKLKQEAEPAHLTGATIRKSEGTARRRGA